MNKEIVYHNIKLIEELNEGFQNIFESVIRIESSYLNWKGEESFSVRVAYDNWPNSEFCMSYEYLVTYEEDVELSQIDLDLFLYAAIKINDREIARRIDAHKRVTR